MKLFSNSVRYGIFEIKIVSVDTATVLSVNRTFLWAPKKNYSAVSDTRFGISRVLAYKRKSLPATLVWVSRSFVTIVWDPWRRGCGCGGSTTSWCAAGGVWKKCACASSAGDRTQVRRRCRPRSTTSRPGRTPFPCCTNRWSSCLEKKKKKSYTRNYNRFVGFFFLFFRFRLVSMFFFFFSSRLRSRYTSKIFDKKFTTSCNLCVLCIRFFFFSIDRICNASFTSRCVYRFCAFVVRRTRAVGSFLEIYVYVFFKYILILLHYCVFHLNAHILYIYMDIFTVYTVFFFLRLLLLLTRFIYLCVWNNKSKSK